MSEWIDVIEETALAHGEHILIEVDGVEVAVFNLNGAFYAIENICTHDGTEIAGGLIENDEIICPRHGARFCLKTGAVKCPPAYENITSYLVQVYNGKIQIYM